MDGVSRGIGDSPRNVEAAVSCLILSSCRISGASNAVHNDAVGERWVDGAHQGGRAGNHGSRAGCSAPRHVTLIFVGPQDIDAGGCKKNRTAEVARIGEVVIRIGGRNADDAFVTGRKRCCAAAVVSCSGNQNNVLVPGVVNRVLQALAETCIAESHQDHGCAVVRCPHHARDDVTVLTQTIRIQNLDRHDLNMIESHPGHSLKIVRAGGNDASEPCSMTVDVRHSIGVVDHGSTWSDRSNQVGMRAIDACIQYCDGRQKLWTDRAVHLVPCHLRKGPLVVIVSVGRGALPLSR